jgi:hypothetical protein
MGQVKVKPGIIVRSTPLLDSIATDHLNRRVCKHIEPERKRRMAFLLEITGWPGALA